MTRSAVAAFFGMVLMASCGGASSNPSNTTPNPPDPCADQGGEEQEALPTCTELADYVFRDMTAAFKDPESDLSKGFDNDEQKEQFRSDNFDRVAENCKELTDEQKRCVMKQPIGIDPSEPCDIESL